MYYNATCTANVSLASSPNSSTAPTGVACISSAATGVASKTPGTTNVTSVSTVNLIVEKHLWSVEQGEMLLDMYDENKEKFKNPAVRKIGVWGDIAKAINVKFGTEYSAEQCHQKLRNFKNDFQKVMMLEKKDCRHFERLHRIFLKSAVKPSQSPAALKRKLTELAGSKSQYGSDVASHKKSRFSLPDIRPRTYSQTIERTKKTNINKTYKKIQPAPLVLQTTKTARGSELPVRMEMIEGENSYMLSRSSASWSQPTVPSHPSYQISNIPASIENKNVSGKEKTLPNSLFYGIPTNSEASSPLSIANTVVDAKGKDFPRRNEVVVLEAETAGKHFNVANGTEANALPVPLYYYSSRGIKPSSVVDQRSDQGIGIPEASIVQSSSQKVALEGNLSSSRTENEKSALGLLKDLFINKKSKDAPKPDSAEVSTRDTFSNGTSGKVIDLDVKNGTGSNCLADGTRFDGISRVLESIDKWRTESEERERAKIQREAEQEKRAEERHRENIRMTSRFVDLFETLVSRINASTD